VNECKRKKRMDGWMDVRLGDACACLLALFTRFPFLEKHMNGSLSIEMQSDRERKTWKAVHVTDPCFVDCFVQSRCACSAR
jgi:hypothetical protein